MRVPPGPSATSPACHPKNRVGRRALHFRNPPKPLAVAVHDLAVVEITPVDLVVFRFRKLIAWHANLGALERSRLLARLHPVQLRDHPIAVHPCVEHAMPHFLAALRALSHHFG